ncbi:SUMF1/EgtB/PvdO family nonheme iron enzyme [Nitrincola alkalilacustris]|uniref:SUMF1/EgtB/PvdO family nonheme iron enzyme n=1 Tax=Nitrincola alkalilacustris TaxID=1571224 RepID=UPI00124C6501|nr:SUMF1/EgtB/PvdO family nonheme iron enzyme [Nitrincola alkalilacustris]
MDSKDTRPPSLAPDQQLGPSHHYFRLSAPGGAHPLGELWSARDISTAGSPEVTLLILDNQLARQEAFLDQLRRALLLTRSIAHPHLASCYGLFADRGGHRFLSFEPLGNRTLATLIQHNQLKSLSLQQKQGLVIQTAKALDTVSRSSHKPHGGLCPELIFLPPGKGVKIIGYHWRAALDPYLTTMSNPLSYTAYQAPEAFHSQPLGLAADIYALAALTYQIYQNKPPFKPDDDESTRYQRELRPPSSLKPAQWQVLKKALSTDIEERQSSLPVLLKELYQESADDNNSAASELPDTGVKGASPIQRKKALSPTLQRLGDQTRAATSRLGEQLSRANTRGFRLFTAGALVGVLIGILIGVALGYLTAPNATDQPIQRVQTTANESEPAAGPEPERYTTGPATSATDAAASGTADQVAELSGSLTDSDHAPQDLDSVEGADTRTRVFQDHFGEGQHAPPMTILPAGSFLMGDLDNRGDDNERPVREVTISRPFALSRHEVTFAEYDQFAQSTGRNLPSDEGWGRGSRPVINVSWHDAVAYTRWLAQQTGHPYRLPTEAEWEYAARAGTDTSYWWGNELLDGHAVCDECGSEWDGERTAPVGQFPANAWGLFDMHGNVDEWVQDCYEDTYIGAPVDGSARTRAGCTHQVMRGGSWFDIPRLIRSSSRYRHPANASRNTWGFRVALDLPE